jgi:hypothetical protein
MSGDGHRSSSNNDHREAHHLDTMPTSAQLIRTRLTGWIAGD